MNNSQPEKLKVKGLDAQAVADALGVSSRTVRRWFAGEVLESEWTEAKPGRWVRVTTERELKAFKRSRT